MKDWQDQEDDQRPGVVDRAQADRAELAQRAAGERLEAGPVQIRLEFLQAIAGRNAVGTDGDDAHLASARDGEMKRSQALGDHGRLTLRTRAVVNATIGTRRHRVVASIQFEDNGPGVPPQIADTIFYPLVTSRPGGTGLGLAVAQDLVTRHGGLIEFDSRPGNTVFTLLLPFEESPDA